MSSTPPSNVPLLARRLDLAGVALLLAGGACYLRAYLGMIGIEKNGVDPTSGRLTGIAQYDHFWQLSRLGLAVGALAVVVLLAGAIVTWRARRASLVTEPAVS